MQKIVDYNVKNFSRGALSERKEWVNGGVRDCTNLSPFYLQAQLSAGSCAECIQVVVLVFTGFLRVSNTPVRYWK